MSYETNETDSSIQVIEPSLDSIETSADWLVNVQLGDLRINPFNNNMAYKYSPESSKPEDSGSQLDEPWREMDEWGTWDSEMLESLKDDVEAFKPPRELNVKQSNILVIGPIGAGKSSFFNTILSVFRGYVAGQACCGNAEKSITSRFRMYQVRSKTTGEALSFRICDTRGLEENEGISETEIDLLLDGHVPDAYQFNPSYPLSSDVKGYKATPALGDKMHCVCIVLDGSNASVLSAKMIEKIKKLQMRVHHKGVPQVVLLTKIDTVCPLVDSAVSNVFRSSKILELVDTVSHALGVPRYRVLPMKNYEKEGKIVKDINILALLALRQMLRASEDFMFNFMDNNDKMIESSNTGDIVHVEF